MKNGERGEGKLKEGERGVRVRWVRKRGRGAFAHSSKCRVVKVHLTGGPALHDAPAVGWVKEKERKVQVPTRKGNQDAAERPIEN